MTTRTADDYYAISEKYLIAANEQSERGNHEKAEKLYAKSAIALAKANELAGN